jgi:hypothetical protein
MDPVSPENGVWVLNPFSEGKYSTVSSTIVLQDDVIIKKLSVVSILRTAAGQNEHFSIGLSVENPQTRTLMPLAQVSKKIEQGWTTNNISTEDDQELNIYLEKHTRLFVVAEVNNSSGEPVDYFGSILVESI